jgi:DNA/RNA-binding domain of Phe-tRNA-synthetase-like protein
MSTEPPLVDRVPAADHPLLRPIVFVTTFPAAMGSIASPAWLVDLLHTDAPTPFTPDERVRTAVRDALRVHGYKPTGRGKPASEYLVRAAADRSLSPINLAVDACNVVSLHSGFPISVIDPDHAAPPFRIDTAGPDQSYVFNPSGQEMRLDGLACLFDALGPCANPVRDSQRTKTSPTTRRTLSVVWGCSGHEDRARRAADWYRELLERAGAETRKVDS